MYLVPLVFEKVESPFYKSSLLKKARLFRSGRTLYAWALSIRVRVEKGKEKGFAAPICGNVV